MLDRAVGRLPDPRASFRARERFSTGRDLEPEITDTTASLQRARAAARRVVRFLRGRRCGIQSLELRLVHREAAPTRVRLRLTRPTSEFAHHRRVSSTSVWRSSQLVEPVRAHPSASGLPIPLAEESGSLFAMNRGRPVQACRNSIERLRARLGTEAVYGLCLVPEHRPELAWRVAEPALPAAKTRNRDRHPKPKCAPASAEGKPLWLLAEPQLLDGDEQPCFEGTLELEQGPERIESGWWDGRDVQRDYYVARNPAGVRLWVFRDRHPPGAGSCMACSAELPDCGVPMSYAELHCLTQFQLPPGRLASGGAGRARGGARLCGARDHGRVLGGRRGACPRGGTRAFAATDRRQRVSPRGRITTRAARDQPRRLWPALPADHPGATCGSQGQLPSHARRPGCPPTDAPSDGGASRDSTDCLALWLPGKTPCAADGRWLAGLFPDRLWIAVELLTSGQDRRRLASLQALGRELGLPLVGGGRRAHARTRPARAAGCAHRDASAHHRRARGSRAASERRASSAPAFPAARDLSTRADRGDP